MELQQTSQEIWAQKYQLKDEHGNPVDKNVNDMNSRVAKALSKNENDSALWNKEFMWALENGATPAGRIMSNAGAEKYKPATSLINCTASESISDSMDGIMHSVHQSALTLKAGCGIGYEFSTLRPKGAYVGGAGATTSGPIPFMDIFDKMCFTVSSAGGRRGAQMGTFAIWHPDVEDFISAKREDGRLRQFNLSLLIDDEFMEAVKSDLDYNLLFPITHKEFETFKYEESVTVWKTLFWDENYCIENGFVVANNKIKCKIYKTLKARDLYNNIMKSTYDFAEPGFLLIDRINKENNNWFCETIRTANPCAEQPLPPNGSCLLGSINLTCFVNDPFTDKSKFNWEKFRKIVRIFTRMLDNVVELNGLPLTEQKKEIELKRRHGMGFLGLGSAMSLLGIKYGDENSIVFTEEVMKVMAIEGYKEGARLAKEKGPAPILLSGDNLSLWLSSPFMSKLCKEDEELSLMLNEDGCRFTHATSIAPTGTISLSINNNTSNGIEPTFAHKYTRNIIKKGRKTKIAETVYSYEMLLYKSVTGNDEIPSFFSTSDSVSTKQHIDIQAVTQKWCDSSISKTINVPSDMPFDDFEDVYLYAYEKGLKGCTTFRFNPEVFQGVLVKDDDLEATEYLFSLESGEEFTVKGNDEIEYEGELQSAANLYDALKEGYYGKF